MSFNARNSALVAKSTLMGATDMGKENRNDEGFFSGFWLLVGLHVRCTQTGAEYRSFFVGDKT